MQSVGETDLAVKVLSKHISALHIREPLEQTEVLFGPVFDLLVQLRSSVSSLPIFTIQIQLLARFA